MAIPLLDLKREYAAIKDDVQQALAAALEKMQLFKGENVAAFEREIAAYIGTAHASGVASGTDALLLTVLGLGIGAGDEVIMQANAFAAALEAVHYAGAQPVLVDVEQEGLGPDPQAVADAVTPRTRAVIAVHLYGSPLNLDRVAAISAEHHLALIEDASHAHGASRDGRRVGAVGRAGCFSCGVVKNLGAYGDAGFVATSDTELVSRLRLLQTHGQEKKNHHVLFGFNSRLDEVQAAVLRIKLRHLDARNRRRQQIASYYSERFGAFDVRVPRELPGEVHVYHQYVIRTAQRQRLRTHLQDAGVQTGVHYPVPLHRQPSWQRRYGGSATFPCAERLADEIISLPVFPDLTDAEIEHIVGSVRAFFQQ